MSIIEGKEIKHDMREVADVLVIGTGMGGATMAMRLAEAGKRVVVLERGGYYTGLVDPLDPTKPGRGELDQREDDMFARIDGGRGLTSTEDFGAALTFGNCVGGATVHYWADSYRTPRDRLELWEREYGVEGHSEDELRPHFETLERDLSIHAATEEYLNGCNLIFREGVRALGWHGEPVPQARAGCLKTGFCMQGCAYNAKQSMLVTYVPRAVRAGAKVFADCRVDRITSENGRATGAVATVMDRDANRATGVRVTVTAGVTVLAAGGFGSAPILMRSQLCGSSGQLGKNLHANANAMCFGLFDRDVFMWRNIPAGFGCDEWRLARKRNGRYVEGGYLLMPNQLGPATLSVMLPGFGADHRRLMERLPQIASTTAWIDDVESGDITLGRDGGARYRLPLVGQNALELRDAMKKGAQVLFAAGAREVFLGDAVGTRIRGEDELHVIDRVEIGPGAMMFPVPHPAGACRMGRDPATSVVKSTGETHDVANLYVADPSVFPTAVSVDPSETIGAFSHRLADGLLERAVG